MADPGKYDNLFPRYAEGVKAEAYLNEKTKEPVPAFQAKSHPVDLHRDVIEEALAAEARGDFHYNPEGVSTLKGVSASKPVVSPPAAFSSPSNKRSTSPPPAPAASSPPAPSSASSAPSPLVQPVAPPPAVSPPKPVEVEEDEEEEDEIEEEQVEVDNAFV